LITSLIVLTPKIKSIISSYLRNKLKEKLANQYSFPDESSGEEFNSSRIVTDIEWIPSQPDLLLVSYDKGERREDSEQEGLINIWSTSMRTKPNISLIFQSEITKAISNPFNPNEIIGGTYAGYVVIWDIRAKKTPVQKSQLNGEGHSYPIYSLTVLGSDRTSNIVSVSGNGKLCVWPMGMLTSPQRALDLKYNAKEVCVTCMEFPQNERNEFYVGAEDYLLYSAEIQTTVDIGKENPGVIDAYQSHNAPITSLSLHPMQPNWYNSLEYQRLILTSSMDWTIKMWNPRTSKFPIALFESSQDYVFDVKWSPTHPSVFVSCDIEGYVDIWDLNTDMETPVLHHRKTPGAIHRLAWSPDGKRLATGGVNGLVHIYNTDKEVM